jgi:hypothetical protein
MKLEEQFNKASDLLIKHAKRGRVYAIPFVRKEAADAAKKLIDDGWYAAAKKWACLSFHSKHRFIALDNGLYGCAVFRDYKTARQMTFNQLGKYDVSLMEIDPSKKGIYALKKYWVSVRVHNPGGFAI